MNRAEKRRQRKLAGKAAKHAKTLQTISLSPDQKPINIPQALELAVQHHSVGRLPEAESIYQKIVRTDSNQHVAIQLLGVIAHQVGKNDIAVDLITRALSIKPDYPEAHNNLGIALKELGKLDQAVTSYHKAIALKPDYVDAHNNLGTALQELGKLDEAATCYLKTLDLKPDFADAHANLGNVLKEQGKLDEAVARYRQALAIRPDYAEVHNILGIALKNMGKLSEAFKCHQRAVAINPQNDMLWAGLAETLKAVSFTSVDEDIWQVLLQLLEQSTVRPSDVAQSILSALRHHQSFAHVLEFSTSEKPKTKIVFADAAQQLSTIPLFLRIMALCSLYDLKIERMLTSLRCVMIEDAVAEKLDEDGLPFIAALALQCFTNEYVFSETDAEKALIEHLEQRIAMLVKEDQKVPPCLIAALGCYRPLYYYPWAQTLNKQTWEDDIGSVIVRQITEPLEEQALRTGFSCLTPIDNTVSQSVREQYEENPYPRWIRTYVQNKTRPIGAVLTGKPHHLDLGDYVSPEQPEILIAGCGTGQQILNATSQFSNAHILAVDLSLSSLSYASRKARELGLTNIEFAQADIMELGNIGRAFDLIGCTGVLHHLGDPQAGWQVLVNLLLPGGLMKIALYSETARQDIVKGRSFISKQGYSTSPEDIRRCRQDIIALAEDGNSEMARICAKRDFFSLSECRDLLFHVQEHSFTLPQIEQALKALKLEFVGFEIGNQSTLNKISDMHACTPAQLSLSQWHEFELDNPDTFWGMYQFWCRKM